MGTDAPAAGSDSLRERLLDREVQLRTAQEMAEFGIWEWEIATGRVEWSEQLHAIYGTTPDTYEPTYEGYLERVHPDDRERVAGAIERAFGNRQPFSFDERIVWPGGEIRTLRSRGRVVVDDEGNALRMIGVCQDVTEQRNAEAHVRETAERFAEAQAIASLGSWEWDIANDVVACSDEMLRIYGLEPGSSPASYGRVLERIHHEDRERVEAIVREAFAAGGDFAFEYRVVRPDGTVRLLEANGRAIAGPEGTPVRMIGTGHDVTDQRRTQEQAAHAATALEMAEQTAKLHRITEAALVHLGLEELLPTLLDRICEALDIENGAVLLMEEDGETLTLRAARGLGASEIGYRLTIGEGFAGRVAHERRMFVIEERAHAYVTSPALKEARLESMIGVPLLVGDEVLGVLHVGSVDQRSFGADAIGLVELAGERAALAIDHARVYERERSIAETLQRALLPAKLPALTGMSVAVRYVPATEGTEIGGDWYDVIPLQAGHVGVVLGDVTGHGLEAAALMAQLRHGLRAYALEALEPAAVAERLDRLVHTPDFERLATLVYAIVSPARAIEYVNAGHLPPLLLNRAGKTRYLDAPGGLPVGCHAGGYVTERVRLEPGDVLILYTDGLIERRGESISVGLERLRRAAEAGPEDPEELADHLLHALLPGNTGEDDIALVTVRPEQVPARRSV